MKNWISFGFGEIRNENRKTKWEVARIEQEEGSCEGWVCFVKTASLIAGKGKKACK